MAVFSRLRAEALHGVAMGHSDNGDDDAALETYRAALDLDPRRAQTHFNIGLIYKHRQDWQRSFNHNRTAYELRPDDEATQWNLAIAATALGDWATARAIWRAQGLDVGDGDGPIEVDFGSTPVRLNPDGGAEVVWGKRIDPVRARIESLPFSNSGFFYGDIVLHDGAPVGQRKVGDRVYDVFNAFSRIERSAFATVIVEVCAASEADIDLLIEAARDAGLPAEHWTSTVRFICRACSEGRPHETHDHDLAENAVWEPQREVAFASDKAGEVEALLAAWSAPPARAVSSVSRFED